MAQTRKAASKPAAKDTLYCSFCGKSQHEVERLIAGPTVFICDECTELCEDIIWTERDNRIAIRIRVPIGSAFDDLLNDAVGKILSEAFPQHDVQYEFRVPDKNTNSRNSVSLAVFTISRAERDAEVLKRQVTELAAKLTVTKEKFINESDRARRISEELIQLKSEYLEVLRKDVAAMREAESDIRSVMFLDVSGFSKFTYENKKSVVDMLRGITPPLLTGRGAHEINMWGDAIVATFTDPAQAIASAVKFLRHLAVEQLDARIGMAWGAVRMNYNPATGRKDIDGPIVDFAARLEPMADLGSILCTTEFSALEIDKELFELNPVQKEIKKDFASYKAGQFIDVLEVRCLKN